jgi:hypothetical protein
MLKHPLRCRESVPQVQGWTSKKKKKKKKSDNDVTIKKKRVSWGDILVSLHTWKLQDSKNAGH